MLGQIVPITSAVALATALFTSAGCGGNGLRGDTSVAVAAPAPLGTSVQHVTVVNVYPHDTHAFTQGLLYRDSSFFESTGLVDSSELREVDLRTGVVRRNLKIPAPYFCEGLALLGGKLYQLTWQDTIAFVYDAATFRKLSQFGYKGEGWGLTTDGTSLIMSDGTSRLRFLDPATFAVRRTVDVTSAGMSVSQLNELEWVKGEIYANVWQTDQIVRIDPATGLVKGTLDLAGLLTATERQGTGVDVLNGIAYDSVGDRLFVTGKRWPKLFEVRFP